MQAKWFVYKNEVVSGPFSAEDVKSKLEQNAVAETDLIFGTGMKAWDKVSWWLTEVTRLSAYQPAALPDVKSTRAAPAPQPTAAPARVAALTPAPAPAAKVSAADAPTTFVPVHVAAASADQDATKMVKVQSDAPTVQLAVAKAGAPSVAWHFALGGKSLGPFDYANLIEELKTAEPLHEVMLWTKGMKEWAPIFEFHDLLSDLQANKRAFPRADIDGKVTLKVEGQTLTAELLTISEGGVSLRLDRGVRSGQSAQIAIQSRAFGLELNARADVRFAVNGIVGLRFSSVPVEAKKLIAEYVQQAINTRFETQAA